MTTCQPAELNVPQWNSACWVTICLAPTPLPPHTPPPYLPPPGKRKHSLTPTPLHSASVPHIAEGKHCPSSAQGWSPPAGFSGELVHGGGGWWLVEELSIVSLLISRHDGIPGSCLSQGYPNNTWCSQLLLLCALMSMVHVVHVYTVLLVNVPYLSCRIARSQGDKWTRIQAELGCFNQLEFNAV